MKLKEMSSLIVIAFVLSCTQAAFAAAPKKMDLSPEEIQAIGRQHDLLNERGMSSLRRESSAARPFSELEEAGYLFFSADTDFDSLEAKQIMARDLPDDVMLVIYTEPGRSRDRILRQYEGLIDPDRLRVVEVQGASRGFWTRDGLPVPVWDKAGKMGMVDARYYHRFEPDQTFASWFQALLSQHEYYFEGGNFMVNDRGDCITVDNDMSTSIPERIFRELYGCQRLIRLPFLKGIGHIDESVRFIGTNSVVTDDQQYAQTLKGEGFDVHLLPRPDEEYETYVNALLVNGTIFVPVFNESNDQAAVEVYRSAGLNVVPIETRTLANQGLGSIHCITMTYPKVPFQTLLNHIGGRELE
ncbi:MAG: agmatine deiminase family protein [Bdellovibrionales bacterium]